MSPGPERALDRPLAALARGDWRSTYAQVAKLSRELYPDEDGQHVTKLLVTMRLVARSMLMHTYGQPAPGWSALAQAAGACRPALPGLSRLTPPSPVALFVLPTPATDPYWGRLAEIGRREEDAIRTQRARLLSAASAEAAGARPERESLTAPQLALLEAVIDHLSWVELDPTTWQAPVEAEAAAACFPLTRSGLGEVGRNYLLRRATLLYQSVFPREGEVTRGVWDQMGGGYRQVRGRALQELNQRCDDAESISIPYRLGYARALEDASLWSKGANDAKMD